MQDDSLEVIAINFEKSITAWDQIIDSGIVILEDNSVFTYNINKNNSSINIEIDEPLPSFHYYINQPNIKINPATNSYVIWESIENGSTWMLSAQMPKPNWINLDSTSYAIISPFAPELDESEFFKIIYHSNGNEILSGPTAWFEGFAEFTALAKFRDYTPQKWMNISLQDYPEAFYTKWLNHYSDKSFIDGRYSEDSNNFDFLSEH